MMEMSTLAEDMVSQEVGVVEEDVDKRHLLDCILCLSLVTTLIVGWSVALIDFVFILRLYELIVFIISECLNLLSLNISCKC